MLKMFWDFEKSLKKGKNLGKFWLKLKKVNFSFLVPHFSPRNEKLEKNENENFSFSLQPISVGHIALSEIVDINKSGKNMQ